MRSPRSLIILLLVAVVVGGATLSWAAPGDELEVSTSTLARKLVKSRTQKMEAFCLLEMKLENCGNLALGPVEFTSGPDEDQVVVVRFTIQYRTSRGDSGLLGASLGPVGDDHANMLPGTYYVSSSPARTTTTVTWVSGDLTPNTDYSVLLSANSVRKEGTESNLLHFSSVAEVELTTP